MPDGPLRRLIARHLQLERLEHAEVSLHLVAFDLLSGQEVRLSAGPALDAVLAAAAIPGVLAPVHRNGQLLVDGGIVNNTPISHAVELGVQRIYVLPTHDPGARGLPAGPRSAVDAAVHASTLLANARLQGDLIRYSGAAEVIVLPARNPAHVLPTDFGHAERLISSGLQAAREVLDALHLAEPIAA